MKKTETLKKNYEFKNVLTRGKFYRGKYINIYVLKNKRQKNNIGIAVSKKVAGAVKRNRIKRVIRESYAKQEEKIKDFCDIVIIWKKEAGSKEARYANVSSDMEGILKRAGLI